MTAQTNGDEFSGRPAERRAGARLTPVRHGGLPAALHGLASRGGGKEPPSESLLDFYQQAEAAAVTFAEDGGPAEAAFRSTVVDAPTEEDAVQIGRVFAGDLVTIYGAFIGSITELEPPPEVAEVHGDFVEAGANAAAVLGEMQDAVDEAQTSAEVLRYMPQAFTRAELTAFAAACRGLQVEADDRGIDVNLSCR